MSSLTVKAVAAVFGRLLNSRSPGGKFHRVREIGSATDDSQMRSFSAYLAAIAAAAVSLTFNGCKPDASFRVEMEISTIQGDGTLTVKGKTNLPDGTKASIVLFGDDDAIESVSCDDSPTIRDGAFTTVPLNYLGGPLPAGSYTLRVTSTSTDDQPEHVRTIMGKSGVNLTGPLVTGEPGVSGIAVVEQHVTIASEVSLRKRDELRDALAQRRADLNKLWQGLEGFKHDADFMRYGFTPRGHQDWLNQVEAIRKQDTTQAGTIRAGAGVLIQLGQEYLSTKGEDNDSVRIYREQLVHHVRP